MAEQGGDTELRALHRALEATPRPLAGRIEASFGKRQGDGALIAPAERGHYEALAGDGAAATLAELGEVVVRPHVERLLSIVDGSGPRMALLLGAHSSLLEGSAVARLPESDLVALLDWAAREGDLLSRVAAVELGLPALPRAPSLADLLERLVHSILEQDPEDQDGRLALLGGTVAYITSELSRTGALDHLQPFHRRLAVFAQASFFERIVFGRMDAQVVGKWTLEHGLRRFYFQTMVDRRAEPRWPPEHASPAQLRAEFVSRVSIAAGAHEAGIPPGPLRDLLLSETGGVRAAVQFPQSFLPGPLEGATEEQRQPLPPEYDRMLDDTLAADALEPRSVIALINLRSLFAIDPARVGRAVQLIREAGQRFDVSVGVEARRSLIAGLAALAADTRSVDLADEVRLMVRKDVALGDGPFTLSDELAIALTAAAARADWKGWAEYLADWCNDIAFRASTAGAAQLEDSLELLCLIDPPLRRLLGAAKVALAAAAAIA